MNAPTVLIVLGATGDLAARKIYPALYHLFSRQKLPKLLQVVGFARREFSDDAFRDIVLESLQHYRQEYNPETVQEFLKHFRYCQGEFTNAEGFEKLGKLLGRVDGDWNACSNKLFYLAVPPTYYQSIFNELANSGLTEPCSDLTGWTRVIVEKPFGTNEETAYQLDEQLGRLFKEEQIYRIDHYLGKEIVQNILALRFANNLFEESWNSRFIEKIDIRLFEQLDVGRRGAFYDETGALHDVGQNHLLQMLTLGAMANPEGFAAEGMRAKRTEILKALIPVDITKDTVRSQYTGYREEAGVKSDSQTETYFNITAYLDHPSWKGVPITLEAGKAMGEDCKEIVLTFKHPAPCVCPPGMPHSMNSITITFDPKESITLRLWLKKPGLEFKLQEHRVELITPQEAEDDESAQAYERLILDCIAGDQTLFVSTDEIRAMWKFIDPIRQAWDANAIPLTQYEKGTTPNVTKG